MIYCNMYLSRKSIFQKVHFFIHKWTLGTLFLQFIQGLELFNNICFRRMLFPVTQMMVQTSLFHIKTLIITFRISCLLNIVLMRIFPHRIIQPNTFLEYCVCNYVKILQTHSMLVLIPYQIAFNSLMCILLWGQLICTLLFIVVPPKFVTNFYSTHLIRPLQLFLHFNNHVVFFQVVPSSHLCVHIYLIIVAIP